MLIFINSVRCSGVVFAFPVVGVRFEDLGMELAGISTADDAEAMGKEPFHYPLSICVGLRSVRQCGGDEMAKDSCHRKEFHRF